MDAIKGKLMAVRDEIDRQITILSKKQDKARTPEQSKHKRLLHGIAFLCLRRLARAEQYVFTLHHWRH